MKYFGKSLQSIRFSQYEIAKREPIESALERVCDWVVDDRFQTDQADQNKEDKGEYNLESRATHKIDSESKPDRNDIVEQMEAMELRRISEDLPLNERDNLVEVADVEVLPDQSEEPNETDSHFNPDQMQVRHESSSSAMQVEGNSSNCNTKPTFIITCSLC